MNIRTVNLILPLYLGSVNLFHYKYVIMIIIITIVLLLLLLLRIKMIVMMMMIFLMFFLFYYMRIPHNITTFVFIKK